MMYLQLPSLGREDVSLMYTRIIRALLHVSYLLQWNFRCLSHLPTAVGKDPAHFDLSLARKQKKGPSCGDWLVLQLQELVSLAYQVRVSKQWLLGFLHLAISKSNSIY